MHNSLIREWARTRIHGVCVSWFSNGPSIRRAAFSALSRSPSFSHRKLAKPLAIPASTGSSPSHSASSAEGSDPRNSGAMLSTFARALITVLGGPGGRRRRVTSGRSLRGPGIKKV